MQTNCHTCGRRLTPRLKSLLKVSAVGRPTFGSSPVALPHTQPGPRKPLSAAGRPAQQAFIHQRTMTDILEACPCIPKQPHLPQTAQQVKKYLKKQETLRYRKHRNSLRWKGTWFRGWELNEFHLTWICTFNTWHNGRSTFNKYIKFTQETKRQIRDWFYLYQPDFETPLFFIPHKKPKDND